MFKKINVKKYRKKVTINRLLPEERPDKRHETNKREHKVCYLIVKFENVV